MKSDYVLSEYEKLVEEVIYETTAPYTPRLRVAEESTGSGTAWNITPENPEAASIYIYGVDTKTINVMVADKYWLEMFTDQKDWNEGLELFKAHLKAIMDGKATGWHDNHDEPGSKTLIEVHTGRRKPYRWYKNILFPGRFKKKPSTIETHYQSY